MTYNMALGYEMDDDEDKKLDDKVLEYQHGKTAKEMKKEDEEDENELSRKKILNSAFWDYIEEEKDKYLDGDVSLDEFLKETIKWCNGCIGKEDELEDMLEDDDEDEKEEKDNKDDEDDEKEDED